MARHDYTVTAVLYIDNTLTPLPQPEPNHPGPATAHGHRLCDASCAIALSYVQAPVGPTTLQRSQMARQHVFHVSIGDLVLLCWAGLAPRRSNTCIE